jgi:hypothetical protein
MIFFGGIDTQGSDDAPQPQGVISNGVAVVEGRAPTTLDSKFFKSPHALLRGGWVSAKMGLWRRKNRSMTRAFMS